MIREEEESKDAEFIAQRADWKSDTILKCL